MGRLDKYARQSKRKEPSKVLPIRLPESVYIQFQQRCEELGLSMSEAGYLLIKEEIEDSLYNKYTNEVTTTTEPLQPSIQEEGYSTIKGATPKPLFSSTRWTSIPYEIENELPCPLCNQWYSKANFSRHAKQHHVTTREILESHKEIVHQMIQNRKSN
ncbi:hypothetical protein [Priestia megaterium]|uniref:hypothetical protein n=1 Tax=Priestia megaterium TaxID=1404 RepID=UPI00203D3A85|nr:hypothetical protein [Priestia megaterium]MCM3197185.1 hypothetical protein [Priestia megaterium]